MNSIRKEFLEAQDVLTSFIANDKNIEAIESAGALIVNTFKNMCDAMHFAEELSGRYRSDRPALPAVSISDPSHITCVLNDYGSDAVFSRYVEGVGFEGDVLVAISTSGNSANVIQAAKTAREKGMKVIALTGKTGGALAAYADVEIRAPHSEFADRVQEIHIKVIHSLIHYIEQIYFG
jgi:D-sedoheptulose 7-phosphate isomerase